MIQSSNIIYGKLEIPAGAFLAPFNQNRRVLEETLSDTATLEITSVPTSILQNTATEISREMTPYVQDFFPYTDGKLAYHEAVRSPTLKLTVPSRCQHPLPFPSRNHSFSWHACEIINQTISVWVNSTKSRVCGNAAPDYNWLNKTSKLTPSLTLFTMTESTLLFSTLTELKKRNLQLPASSSAKTKRPYCTHSWDCSLLEYCCLTFSGDSIDT